VAAVALFLVGAFRRLGESRLKLLLGPLLDLNGEDQGERLVRVLDDLLHVLEDRVFLLLAERRQGGRREQDEGGGEYPRGRADAGHGTSFAGGWVRASGTIVRPRPAVGSRGASG